MMPRLKQTVEHIGVPRLIIAGFLAIIFVIAYLTDMSVPPTDYRLSCQSRHERHTSPGNGSDDKLRSRS